MDPNEIMEETVDAPELPEENDETLDEPFEEEEGSDEGEEAEHGPDFDGDFDYDENGDILLPEDEEEDGDDPEKAPGETPERGAEDEGTTGTDAPPTAESHGKAKARPSERETRLERDMGALESQAIDTMRALGVPLSNKPTPAEVMRALMKMAAEASDTSLSEYARRRAETMRAETATREAQESARVAARTAQATAFARRKAEDLAAVHAAYPETREIDDVERLPNFAQFARYRDLGLDCKAAYIAANPDGVRQSVADATRRQELGKTKEHLRPAVSKESRDTSIRITRREMSTYRDMFPDLSDREIVALHRQASRK